MCIRDRYGGHDPREIPIYPLNQAARFLQMPKSTLGLWVFGGDWKPRGQPKRHFYPLIDPPSRDRKYLSFVNLVEAHVLRSLRHTHSVRMDEVRYAIDDLKQRFGTARPLADVDLLAGNRGVYLLAERGQLENVGKGRQIALDFLVAYLNRIDRETVSEKAMKLFPFLTPPIKIGRQVKEHDVKIVAIDPYVSFGRPIINGTSIPTTEIADRIWGGDDLIDVMEDFGRSETEVLYAVRWEHAQAVHA